MPADLPISGIAPVDVFLFLIGRELAARGQYFFVSLSFNSA